MNIEEALIKLQELHLEFGNLISRLEDVDNGEDMEFYEWIIQDVHWNNIMLSNRFKKMLNKRGSLE